MLIFGVLFTTILLLATWLAAKTWYVFAGCRSVWWLIVPMVILGAYVPVMFASYFSRNSALEMASVATSVAMGALNYAFFAAVFCWVIYGAALLFRLHPDTKIIAQVFYGLALLAVILGLVNGACIRTTRVAVALHNLPEGWRGKEVALVSDVHLGRVLGRGFSGRVVRHLESLSPQAVLIAGDIFDGPEAQPDALLEPWKQLHPPAGAYFVTGNHDEFGDAESLKAAVTRAGIRVLSDEKVLVDGLQIIGFDDGLTRSQSAYTSGFERLGIDRTSPSILLVHQPDHLDVAEKAGISLQLSGHTHGGQFWPWNMAVNAIYGAAAHGLSRHGNLQLYTSYGVGTWGPPLRLFTRPEIILIRLENE
jgi:predicted MPP superfamily phosphohydrolase